MFARPVRTRCRFGLGRGLPLVILVALGACGKKGPPLAPLPQIPVAPEQATARRRGSEVVVEFTVPAANRGGARPASIERVDVYALTGPPVGMALFYKYATVVGSVPVRRPPPEPEEAEEGQPPPPPPPPSTEPGLDQGARARFVETLSDAAFQPTVIRELEEQKAEEEQVRLRRLAERGEPRLRGPDIGPELPPLPTRTYVVVGVNRKGRRGVESARMPVRLVQAPEAPGQPEARLSAEGVALTWTAPSRVRAPIMRTVKRGESELLPARMLPLYPQTTTGYVVDEVPPPGATVPALEPGAVPPLPARLTAAPLEALSYLDPRVEFGRERCYVVRTVETTGSETLESAASPPVCVTMADTFPPAAPASLAAVASEGAISLIWEASPDTDLAGYVVLRGDAGGPLKPITPEPIADTTYRDTAVSAGVRYAYAVVAVDKATPPNLSAQSNRAEETAR